MPHKIQLVKSKSLIVKGTDVLKFEGGSLFKVTHPDDSAANNAVVLRTSYVSHPFVNLADGSLWGRDIENYTFELIPAKQIFIEI